ncbi:MAG: adenosylcobinamide-GDP ribazoletransferase [Rhodospirillum sp.]|nr:adenosylcobinamide-GDP ribazoletransferase [Rhodospirillum sp.]MCF8488677.1 adenosylcobinamide-GDP ribazoletransferase [Rhodospirillum sp.]MCF8502563.1 adenosylcobinamide-GDP ribazoletransferase [Rhodospirillum sp.]
MHPLTDLSSNTVSLLGRRLGELNGAVCFLTRLPLPLKKAPPPLSQCIWAFPLVGALVGLVGAGVALLASIATLPDLASAVLALGAMALLTGALHEDALADMADGLGGGRTKERALEIMRDSRVGAFGLVTLILVLGLRAALIAPLVASPWLPPALVAAAAIGRGGAALVLGLLDPARPDGLGATAARPGSGPMAACLILTGAVAGLLFTGGRAAAGALLGGLLVTLWVAWRAWARLGGQTGDIAGAAALLAETGALLGALVLLGGTGP